MIFIELLVGMMIAAFVLLLLPLVLVMIGVVGTVTLLFVAPAAFLGLLLFWLIFPGAHGLAVLVVVLIIGLLLLDRRSRRTDQPRW